MVPVFTVLVFYEVAYSYFFFAHVYRLTCPRADVHGGGNCLCTIEILVIVSLIAFHV